MDNEKIDVLYGYSVVRPVLGIKIEVKKPSFFGIISQEISNVLEFIIPALLFSLSITCLSIVFH